MIKKPYKGLNKKVPAKINPSNFFGISGSIKKIKIKNAKIVLKTDGVGRKNLKRKYLNKRKPKQQKKITTLLLKNRLEKTNIIKINRPKWNNGINL